MLSTCVAIWSAVRAIDAESRAQDSLVAETQQKQIAESRSADLHDMTEDLRRKNYAFAMESAFRAWQVGSLAQLQDMLPPQVPTANDQDLRGFEWRFLDARCKENLLSPLLQTDSSVKSVAYSPSGKHLAIMLATGDLLLHDTVTNHTDTLNKGDGWIGELSGTDIAFSPSGDFLVGRGTSHLEVYVWRATADEAMPFTRDENIAVRHTLGVRSVAVSPDGKLAASASDGNTTFVWDARTGDIRQTLTGDSVAFAHERSAPADHKLPSTFADALERSNG